MAAGTTATSRIRWVQHEQNQLLIVFCSPCSMRRIPVRDHALAQTLWACSGASENAFPPKAWPDCGILLAGRRLRLGIVNFLYIVFVFESRS
jgi:hypothetical protein